MHQPKSEMHHYHCESCDNLALKHVLIKKDKSPVKAGVHSKVIVMNDRDKQVSNRNKWENLQKKINALRNENDILKKSLFE